MSERWCCIAAGLGPARQRHRCCDTRWGLWQWLCPECHSTHVRGPPWHPSSGTPKLSTGWFALHASLLLHISLLLLLAMANFFSLTSASSALFTCSARTAGAQSRRWVSAEITRSTARDESRQGKPGHAAQGVTIRRKKTLQSEEKKRWTLQTKIKSAPLWNSDRRIQTNSGCVSTPGVLSHGVWRAQPTVNRCATREGRAGGEELPPAKRQRGEMCRQKSEFTCLVTRL